MGLLVPLPKFPIGKCCYRNKSSFRRGRGVPVGGCPAEGHRNSLGKTSKVRLTIVYILYKSFCIKKKKLHLYYFCSPTMRRSVSGSCLKSFLKSSLRCLQVGLSTLREHRGSSSLIVSIHAYKHPQGQCSYISENHRTFVLTQQALLR